MVYGLRKEVVLTISSTLTFQKAVKLSNDIQMWNSDVEVTM